MMFDAGFIGALRARLDRHPIYESLCSTEDLRVFMAHHVYLVLDFMSLIKYLQHAVAPAPVRFCRVWVSANNRPRFSIIISAVHIHLDEDFYAPLSLRLLEGLCAGDAARVADARSAASRAVKARIGFWDGVCAVLPSRLNRTEAPCPN
jgi:hypothetical protein